MNNKILQRLQQKLVPGINKRYQNYDLRNKDDKKEVEKIHQQIHQIQQQTAEKQLSRRLYRQALINREMEQDSYDLYHIFDQFYFEIIIEHNDQDSEGLQTYYEKAVEQLKDYFQEDMFFTRTHQQAEENIQIIKDQLKISHPKLSFNFDVGAVQGNINDRQKYESPSIQIQRQIENMRVIFEYDELNFCRFQFENNDEIDNNISNNNCFINSIIRYKTKMQLAKKQYKHIQQVIDDFDNLKLRDGKYLQYKDMENFVVKHKIQVFFYNICGEIIKEIKHEQPNFTLNFQYYDKHVYIMNSVSKKSFQQKLKIAKLSSKSLNIVDTKEEYDQLLLQNHLNIRICKHLFNANVDHFVHNKAIYYYKNGEYDQIMKFNQHILNEINLPIDNLNKLFKEYMAQNQIKLKYSFMINKKMPQQIAIRHSFYDMNESEEYFTIDKNSQYSSILNNMKYLSYHNDLIHKITNLDEAQFHRNDKYYYDQKDSFQFKNMYYAQLTIYNMFQEENNDPLVFIGYFDGQTIMELKKNNDIKKYITISIMQEIECQSYENPFYGKIEQLYKIASEYGFRPLIKKMINVFIGKFGIINQKMNPFYKQEADSFIACLKSDQYLTKHHVLNENISLHEQNTNTLKFNILQKIKNKQLKNNQHNIINSYQIISKANLQVLLKSIELRQQGHKIINIFCDSITFQKGQQEIQFDKDPFHGWKFETPKIRQQKQPEQIWCKRMENVCIDFESIKRKNDVQQKRYLQKLEQTHGQDKELMIEGNKLQQKEFKKIEKTTLKYKLSFNIFNNYAGCGKTFRILNELEQNNNNIVICYNWLQASEYVLKGYKCQIYEYLVQNYKKLITYAQINTYFEKCKKSTKMQNSLQDIEELHQHFIQLNKVQLNTTFQSENIYENIKNCKIMYIDECFMMNQDKLYQMLYLIKLYINNDIQFRLFGDNQQLKPIDQNGCFQLLDHFKTEIIEEYMPRRNIFTKQDYCEMLGKNNLELFKKCTNIMQQIRPKTIPDYFQQLEQSKLCMVFHTHKEIDEYYEKTFIPLLQKYKKEIIEIQGKTFYVGQLVFANETNRDKQTNNLLYYSNEKFNIKKFENNIITIDNQRISLNIPAKIFIQQFKQSNFTTLHKIQGQTINVMIKQQNYDTFENFSQFFYKYDNYLYTFMSRMTYGK